MPHDLGTWGFIIGIAALVLAFPLSVLANITSPQIRDWWAARSSAMLQKRYDFLSAQLDQLHDVPVIDEVAEVALRSLYAIIFAIGQAANIVVGAIEITHYSSEELFRIIPHGKLLVLLAVAALNSSFTLALCWPLRRYLRRVSPVFRENIKAEVIKLDKALRKRQQTTFQKR